MVPSAFKSPTTVACGVDLGDGLRSSPEALGMRDQVPLVSSIVMATRYPSPSALKAMEGSPARARSIVDGGHRIQNHSWSHINLQTAPESSVREQVTKTQAIIRDVTGVTPTKLRPPYGAGGWARRFDPEIVKVAGEFSLKIENWDIDTEDWKAPQGIGPPKVARVREEIAKKSSHRLVVLMHVQPATARDLPQFIETLKGWGFAFARP
jgi:peptidoglycan/xylan/chitin deacetylase (PgdA/CDA1 family)